MHMTGMLAAAKKAATRVLNIISNSEKKDGEQLNSKTEKIRVLARALLSRSRGHYVNIPLVLANFEDKVDSTVNIMLPCVKNVVVVMMGTYSIDP
jgi:hypothetical protein